MKFSFPLAEGKLTAHFGHCQEFALVEVEDDQIKSKETLVPPPHEPGVLPKGCMTRVPMSAIIDGNCQLQVVSCLLVNREI